MKMIEILGLFSIIMLNSGWAIQAYQVFKTKKVRDLSFLFLSVAFFSFIGLQIYTILNVESVPYLVGNSIGITFVGILFYQKIKYREN
ncbi:MAG: hypothetical protein ACLFVB_00385 [Thermoplasmata archaeon]